MNGQSWSNVCAELTGIALMVFLFVFRVGLTWEVAFIIVAGSLIPILAEMPIKAIYHWIRRKQ